MPDLVMHDTYFVWSWPLNALLVLVTIVRFWPPQLSSNTSSFDSATPQAPLPPNALLHPSVGIVLCKLCFGGLLLAFPCLAHRCAKLLLHGALHFRQVNLALKSRQVPVVTEWIG